MEAIYRVEGAVAETSAFAGGPWDHRLQHGAAPSSLVCWAAENLPSPVPMRVARLTVDLMRPVPVAPLTIETEILREGRKIQLVAVRLLAGATEVVRATVLRIRILDQPMPAEATTLQLDLPLPEHCQPPDIFAKATPFLTGITMRVARGAFQVCYLSLQQGACGVAAAGVVVRPAIRGRHLAKTKFVWMEDVRIQKQGNSMTGRKAVTNSDPSDDSPTIF